MHRIDESTYIDDTLITCAEYQLFIDEMRKQDKYYQPDHWNSFLFPNGHARKPILGSRHSDAVAFCIWLTQRENGEWRYRLPAHSEAFNYPIESYTQAPLGYWIMDDNNQSGFFWVGPVPLDARQINLASVLAYTHAHLFVRGLLNLSKAHARAFVRSLDLDVERVLTHYRDSVLDLDRDRERLLNLAKALKHGGEIARARHSELGLDLDRVRALNRSDILAFVRTIELILDIILDLENIRVPDLEHVREFALEICINICTLQERIFGLSPAFEGIRLVKERIR